jgi:hypothetical protein
MGDEALERVVERTPVGEPGERVRGRPGLGDGEVAQVGEHGRRLLDAAMYALVLPRVRRVLVDREHRADDLPADEQRPA